MSESNRSESDESAVSQGISTRLLAISLRNEFMNFESSQFGRRGISMGDAFDAHK